MDRPYGSYADVLLKQRYRPGGVIGRGGMSKVYIARDEQLGRDVALKLFSAISHGTDYSVHAAELRVLAGLNHHGIVTLLDAGIDDSVPTEPHPYLIMEFVEGNDLEYALKAGQVPPRAVAEIGYDLAEALSYVHGRGVVHRDIKPSNVLIVDYGTGDARSRARLTDFGIAFDTAAALGPEETNTTGTAAYLSPEQVLRDLVGPASDIYSLGLLLLECFTRKLEYPGDPSTSAVSRLKRDPRIPVELSSAWRSLLGAMLQRDPAQRPAARDVLLALRHIIVEESGRHRSRPMPVPIEEPARMNAVRRYEAFADPSPEAFDRITALARRICDTPVSIVSIVEHDVIRFLSHPGTALTELPREDGLCSSIVFHDEPWVIENALLDPRSADNQLVTGELQVRFYAGVPLKSPDGYNIGVLSVADFVSRTLTDAQLASLSDLAALVTDEFELQVASKSLVSELRPLEDEATPAIRYPHAV
ncbi:serine/threonine protein kinase [Protaetiibacter larvae]|uniref:Protein kinase n=1 Tax=Protaetiibacter larvae TaxID=2592654 RepID=A0A5C1Y6T1_9MICO|nr:protein kinase [Protaetiibacter larvae]QEO09773.1 protein kinase [Protaetiibacter larvae]